MSKMTVGAMPKGKLKRQTLADAEAGQVVFLLETDEGITGHALVVGDSNGHVSPVNNSVVEIAVISLDSEFEILLFPAETPVRFLAARLEVEP